MGLTFGGPYHVGELDELRREEQRQEAKDNYRNFIKSKNSKKGIYKR